MENDIILTLRWATKQCNDRGLYFASKWASELLLAIPQERRNTRGKAREQTVVDNAEAELEEGEQDGLAAGRVLAEAKEYTRAAHLLFDLKSAKAKFMSLYYQYLASEKRALRDWYNLDIKPQAKTQPATPVNKSLLEMLYAVSEATDPWLLFMKALLLKRMGRRDEAIEAVIQSIEGYPWNWSAWMLLSSCLGDREELGAILPLLPLPRSHILVQMFQVKVLIELHQADDSELAIVDGLLGPEFFPNSLWLMSMRASVFSCMHDFQHAEQQFDKILFIDPYRVDDIDVYSNILYVTENRTKLSKIAHHFLTVDKERPEVCCLVGNQYALRSENEKAINYFRRATELNQSYLPAWMLMGHEYIEIKNSHAAIESYRRALDVSRKDYRAWYGLGQAYELLNMHQYALHYYQRATALRPYDVRIWQAQGTCYEELGRLPEAIQCFKRALLGAEPQDISIKQKLARLCHEVRDFASATKYHQMLVEKELRSSHGSLTNSTRSAIYFAKYQMEKSGDLKTAEDYLERVAASTTEDAPVANELLKKLVPQLASETLRRVQREQAMAMLAEENAKKAAAAASQQAAPGS